MYSMLILDIFGEPNPSQNKSKNAKESGQYDFGIDPWASSNLPKDTARTTPTNIGWPTNSDGEREMAFTIEFFAESDFSCKYEASGCNRESIMSTVNVNGGSDSNGLLSSAAGGKQLLIYGGSGVGVILLLVLFIAMRRRNN